VTTAILDNGL